MMNHRARNGSDIFTAVGLAVLAYLIYLLTFSGEVQAMDELQLFDETESFALYQDVIANQTVYLGETDTAKYEIGQPLLAVPLYLLAHNLPHIGIVHLTYQFNLIVTAILIGLFYLYARQLGYSERNSLLGAACLGAGTILWPYTQTFFRESLTALTLFLASFFVLKLKAGQASGESRRWGWLLLLIGSSILAILVRETALLILPIITIGLLPEWDALSKEWKKAASILLAVIAAGVAIVTLLIIFGQATQAFEMENRYNLIIRLRQLINVPPHLLKFGLLGMLLSPGKSLWMYSPVLILALTSPFILSKNRWRESWLPLIMTLALVLAYTALRERYWQGGISWGPRYLVMATPFLMIGAMPAIEKILTSRRWWLKAAFWALLAFSILVQLGGLGVYIHDFLAYRTNAVGILPLEVRPIWQPEWSQAIGSLLYLPQADLDIAWLHDGVKWLPLALIPLSIAAVVTLLIQLRRSEGLLWKRLIAISPLIAFSVMLISLRQVYFDNRYFADFTELMAMIEDLSAESKANEIIVLDSRRYALPFMNTYRGEARWYSSPDAPGDLLNPSVTDPIITDRIEDAAGEALISHLRSFLSPDESMDSILLVSAGNEYVEGAVRPAEWYLSQYSYPLEEREYAPMVRWVRFLPMAVPSGCGDLSQTLSDKDERITLRGVSTQLRSSEGNQVICGYDLTVDEQLSPSDQIGVSLQWEVEESVPLTLISTFQLLDENGVVVKQIDGQPTNGFAPSNEWQSGDVIVDNAGFELDGLPGGTYIIRYGIYTWPDQENWQFTSETGMNVFIHIFTFTIEMNE